MLITEFGLPHNVYDKAVAEKPLLKQQIIVRLWYLTVTPNVQKPTMFLPVDDLQTPNNNQRWIVLCAGKVLVHSDTEQLLEAPWRELEPLHSYGDSVFQLADLNGNPTSYFVIDIGSQVIELENHEYVSLRRAMMASPSHSFETLGRAWQLLYFYQTHRFCGRCGSTMTRVDWEVAVQCFRCDHRCYPRVSPCVIVAIHRKGEILLAQSSRHKSGMFSTIAGFVESGESLEQAVMREVKEEVGVDIHPPKYFDSQPWPFPHALMVGYIAEWKSGDIVIDDNEISEARWFNLDELPFIPPKFSIAGQLIDTVIKANL